jgi:hypothetical protein
MDGWEGRKRNAKADIKIKYGNVRRKAQSQRR